MAQSVPEIVWQPPPDIVGKTPMDQYRQHVNRKFQQNHKNTPELQAWSVANQQPFWLDLYSYLELVPALPEGLTRAYDESLPMSSIPKWYEGVEINYTENVLENARKHPDNIALIGLREGQPLDAPIPKLTWRELERHVAQVSGVLRRKHIKQGDVIAALVSNSIDAVVLFLSTAAIGAVFTSISPDLGAEGCIARLRQVTPKILFADSDATYKGRQTPLLPKINTIMSRLDTKPDTYIIPLTPSAPTHPYKSMTEFLSASAGLPTRPRYPRNSAYARVPFTHPLVICYSSGTTGPPKCIVHQHGLILNLKKISSLHNSLTPADTVLQFSSTSWVLFYIMNGHLATGATTVCYDGSPLFPDARQLIRILARFRASYFGSSPRYLLELEKAGAVPKAEFDLSALRMVNTTGATLSPDQYRWFYRSFPRRVHLANSAGGTDTATSLISADPCGPLRIGEMQVQALGMDIDVADPESGASLRESGMPGEMIVRKPFPSMPAFFWGDEGGRIYRAAYFERFADVDVWAQHDWMSFNPRTGGSVMHGRSDGVLNPSGIRFGSGEIYAIVEGPAFNGEIAETLCVGRWRPSDVDESVFLFVKMATGHRFTDDLLRRLQGAIRDGLSSRHVPRFIVEVEEIPVTINGKKVETAVKQIISGKEIKVSSTVANPECLRGYKSWAEYEGRRDSKL